jgi:chromosome segregation ATPase
MEALAAKDAEMDQLAREVEQERARAARLDDSLGQQQAMREEAEDELTATLEKLATALERVRAAEGADLASRQAVAALESELADARAAVTVVESPSPEPQEHLEQARAELSQAQAELEARDAREAAQREALMTLEQELKEAREELNDAREERDAARANLESAMGEREPASGDEGALHERIHQLEGELRVTAGRAATMEAELASMSDGIQVERTTPIVGVEGDADPGAASRRAAETAERLSPEDFAERLDRANRAAERVADR